MIQLEKDIKKVFTATADILIQNTTPATIKYTTDDTEEIWFNMPRDSLPIQILTGDVIYFMSDRKTALAEMPML